MITKRDVINSERVSFVSPMKIYNLPVFEGYWIIDTRDHNLFIEGHIVTSHSFSTDIQNLNEETFIKFLSDFLLTGNAPEHFSPIVIYGDDYHSESIIRRDWLISQLLNIHNLSLPGNNTEYFSYYLDRIKSSQIWSIEGGYLSFKREFSVLCGNNSEESMCSLPCMIATGLFLGSRATNSLERRARKQLSIELPILRQLEIELIIVNGDASLPVEDTSGITCLIINGEDTDNEDMINNWNFAIEQIERIRQEGKRVLLQYYGRSRSASFAVAWVMKILKLKPEESIKYVQNQCFYTLDKSLMYLDQLYKFYNAQNSINNLTIQN